MASIVVPGLPRLVRAVYSRELLPARARWWLAAQGMCDWFRVLAKQLGPHLGAETRPILGRLAGRMFHQRYAALRAGQPWLPDFGTDAQAVALLMAALYRAPAQVGWIFAGLGGPPRGLPERLRGLALLRRLPTSARWEEVTVHLGELLIVLTEDLPTHLPHARRILGEICFTAGARYAERARAFLGLPAPPHSTPEHAIEVLRMSEYIFRVNPEHWHHSDATAQTGWLEGTACPWYTRPGWHAAHCGIFGQFQAGISSVFGLRYQLAQTIPKHGGTTCRIDLKPIAIRRSKDA